MDLILRKIHNPRVILALILAGAGLLIIFLPRDPRSSAETIFQVQAGEGSREIARNLEKNGLIFSAPAFRLYTAATGHANNLQAGLYRLNPRMSMKTIANRVASGQIAKETLVIPEGWNTRDIAWYLENRGMFQAEELFELVGFPGIDWQKEKELPRPKDFSSNFPMLKEKPSSVGLEGYLFPDTYLVKTGETLENIVKTMLANFQSKILPLEQEIKNQNKTVFEIVTVASLIEKEVRSKEDKKMVSGIIWKRLSVGMPLQIDATVSYLTQKRSVEVSREETKIDSLYNTYAYRGLPLGPITNPGLDSIEAAIRPTASSYWYYLSTPDGDTIFSRTLDEHNAAKAKYLQ